VCIILTNFWDNLKWKMLYLLITCFDFYIFGNKMIVIVLTRIKGLHL